MCLIKRVQVIMRILYNGIQLMPEHKKLENMSKVQAIVQKYNPDKQEDLQQLEKELNRKLKFLELAHPKIKFKLEEEPPQEQEETVKKFVEYEGVQPESQQVIIPNVREEVNFSNWAEGNVDPEDLKRHKKLLDRQHFMGPLWQNKPLPSLSAMQYLEMVNKTKTMPKDDPRIYKQGAQQRKEQQSTDNESRWETFKR